MDFHGNSALYGSRTGPATDEPYCPAELPGRHKWQPDCPAGQYGRATRLVCRRLKTEVATGQGPKWIYTDFPTSGIWAVKNNYLTGEVSEKVWLGRKYSKNLILKGKYTALVINTSSLRYFNLKRS